MVRRPLSVTAGEERLGAVRRGNAQRWQGGGHLAQSPKQDGIFIVPGELKCVPTWHSPPYAAMWSCCACLGGATTTPPANGPTNGATATATGAAACRRAAI